MYVNFTLEHDDDVDEVLYYLRVHNLHCCRSPRDLRHSADVLGQSLRGVFVNENYLEDLGYLLME